MLSLSLALPPISASAQLIEDAAAPVDAGAGEGVKPLKMFRESADAAVPESAPPRPPSGPVVKERGGRRSRGASSASGALFIAVIVLGVGYYVIKRFRRS